MHVNKTKFEGNSSLGYYHMTSIGKQNIQAKEVYYRHLLTIREYLFNVSIQVDLLNLNSQYVEIG